MITLHHLNNSRSQRILWLLEELGLPYEIKRYQRDKVTMLAPPELKAIHPLGKSPVITDGDLVLAESGAIIEYLVNKYGHDRLRPSSEKEQLRYTYWLHYAEGSAMPLLLLALIFNKIDKSAPFFIRPIASKITGTVRKMFINPQLKLHFDFMEGELQKNTWFAGHEFSAADIQMSFPVEAAESRGGLEGRPKLKEYLNKIHSRPAYKRALEKGGEYHIL
ncbi:glutathione S-transferase family protein [Peredibacter sp. HCB2-198]|uniref:glutathione S-transferase family protein n=1 Tax=Peredibacter sp. HCB2-198 TaxID=3383025 RepID=UPI0038B4FCBF